MQPSFFDVFLGAHHVRFGSVDATFDVVSATEITATVPAGSGTVSVSVGNDSEDLATAGTANDFAFAATPAITSTSRALGLAGQTVTLTGAGFLGTTRSSS